MSRKKEAGIPLHAKAWSPLPEEMMGYGDGFLVNTLVNNLDGGGENPVSYYYGKGQTKRVGENYTPSGQGTSKPAEFKATADEVYNGGKNNLLTIQDPSAVPNADVTNGTLQCIVQFPAGRYHLTFQGYSESSFSSSFIVELRQVQSGTDDLIVTETPGFSGGASPARTEYLLSWPDFIVDGTEKFYFLFPMGNDKRSHFLRIEKVA